MSQRLTCFRTTRISPSLSQQLRRLARENEVGESAILRIALRDYLARHRRQPWSRNSRLGGKPRQAKVEPRKTLPKEVTKSGDTPLNRGVNRI